MAWYVWASFAIALSWGVRRDWLPLGAFLVVIAVGPHFTLAQTFALIIGVLLVAASVADHTDT